MNLFLENSFLQLTLAPAHSAWSLSGLERESPVLEELRMSAGYRVGRRRFSALERWEGPELSGPETVASLHGSLRQLNLRCGPDANGLHFTLNFALPDQQPIFLWKLTVNNRGSQAVLLDRLELLQAGSLPGSSRKDGGQPSPGSRIVFHTPARPQALASSLAFFSNGWQSWSYTGVYTPRERYRRTHLGPLRAPTEAGPGSYRLGAGRYRSDLFGVLGDRAGRTAILAGFLSQRQHFGVVEAWLSQERPGLLLWAEGDGARLDPGQELSTDWACLSFLRLDDPDPLGPYLDAVGRENGIPYSPSPLSPGLKKASGDKERRLGVGDRGILAGDVPTGWCSWYQYSSDDYVGAVSAGDIQHNLEALAGLCDRLPLEIVQIDDGFASLPGDWLDFAPSFPGGVAPLAAEIRAAGFTPGLWLAPFIVHPAARLAAEHPDWLLRGRGGRPVNAGFGWNRFTRALDLTHPEVCEWAAGLVHTAVHEWGFPYLKLDFLYAAALPGRRFDPTLSRAQVLRSSLEALRKAAGREAFLVGCACPLGPAIGLFDAMRIGADTARRWHPSVNGIQAFIRSEPNLPAARNALHNTLSRAALHRRWWVNDPDCLLARAGSIPGSRDRPRPGKAKIASYLTLAEVQSAAAAIALTGGSLLLSDDLSALPPERLRLAGTLLPLIERRPQVMDWFDSGNPRRLRLDLEGPAGPWSLLALFNWEDTPRFLTLRLDEFNLDPRESYFARTFWKGEFYRVTEGFLPTRRAPAHGSILLALRTREPGEPQYLGSDLHISQGLELVSWSPSRRGLQLRLERPGPAEGAFDLALPHPPASAHLDGQPVTWKALAEDCYRFPVAFDRTAGLKIEY